MQADHKAAECHSPGKTLDQLPSGSSESAELKERVKELGCLQTLSSLARDEIVSFQSLCQEAANEIPSAFQNPEITSACVRTGDGLYRSKAFKETDRRLSAPFCQSDDSGPCRGKVEVFTDPSGLKGAALFPERKQPFLNSVAELLRLEQERRIKLEEQRMVTRRAMALLRLADDALMKKEREIVQDYLEAAVELTESENGYLHFVNEKEEIVRSFCSPREICAYRDGIPGDDSPIPRSDVGSDYFRNRAPVVHNDPANLENPELLPKGYPPLTRHMSVPVVENGRVVMILGVGNRKPPYANSEIETVQGIAGALWKVVSRHRMEQQQAAANEDLTLLKTALEAASHAIMVTDDQGTIEWVNPAFTKITGYESGEVIGGNASVLKSGKQDDQFYQVLWSTIKAGDVWKGDLVNKRKDGTLYEEEMSITPVKNHLGAIARYIAIKQDVTEQHELEKRFLRSQRMESIGLLAGGIAHDLNNVLAPIMMSAELLKMELPVERRNQILSTIHKSCERGTGIIDQVLTFSRGVDGARAPIQLRRVVKDIVKIALATFPKNIDLQVDIPPDLWHVLGDETQVHQILLNLSVNARDALVIGGILSISARNEELFERRSFLHQEILPGRYVHMKISDTGVGIDPKNLDRIFEPFYTSKKRDKGTGLGLPTVLGIIKSHNGLIEVSSSPGKGTDFDLYFPATDQAIDQKSDQIGPPQRGNGETILLVDDESEVLRITGEVLRQTGYEVLEAGDGAEAVAVYATHRDRIALVLTDIMMPIMDGLALTRALQKVNPEVRIIGSTGFVGNRETGNRAEDLKSLGVKTVLKKPYRLESLLTVLAEELAR